MQDVGGSFYMMANHRTLALTPFDSTHSTMQSIHNVFGTYWAEGVCSRPIGQRGCQLESSTFEILLLFTVSDIRISRFRQTRAIYLITEVPPIYARYCKTPTRNVVSLIR